MAHFYGYPCCSSLGPDYPLAGIGGIIFGVQGKQVSPGAFDDIGPGAIVIPDICRQGDTVGAHAVLVVGQELDPV